MVLGDTLALACVSSLVATVLALGALESAARAGVQRPGAGASARSTCRSSRRRSPSSSACRFSSPIAGFDGTFVAVVIVHLVFVFPYVLLSLSDPWRAWDPRYG